MGIRGNAWFHGRRLVALPRSSAASQPSTKARHSKPMRCTFPTDVMVRGSRRLRISSDPRGACLPRRMASSRRSHLRFVRRRRRRFVSWRLARRHYRRLARRRSRRSSRQIIDAVSRVDGVLEIGRVRIRRAGNRYFADLAVGLARTVTFQRSEQLVKRSPPLCAWHPSRRRRHCATIASRPTVGKISSTGFVPVATRHNLNVHDISVQDLAGKLHVEQHVRTGRAHVPQKRSRSGDRPRSRYAS